MDKKYFQKDNESTEMLSKYTFADRTQWELQENSITQARQSLKHDNIPVLDLTVSNPTKANFKYPQRKILKGFKHKENLIYEPEAHGLKKACEAVADYFKVRGFATDVDHIFLTASTSEAYSYIFRLIANPDDIVLFPQPSYPLFSFLGDLHDVHLEFYQLKYDQYWAIDFDSLEAQITSNVKAICLVNPNNPTGSYVSKEEIKKLETLCQKHGLVIICDEVFWEFSLDQEMQESLLNTDSVPTCVLGGLSKTLGMPQMKLSWLMLNGPQEWLTQAIPKLEVIADTFLSVNTPTQNALADWLKISPVLQGEIHNRIIQNLNFLKNQVITIKSVELLAVQGGWYAILKVPSVRSEEEWVLKLLTKYHVLVHPGYFYDFVDEPYLVLSLLPESRVFQEGTQRIISRIEQQCG